MFIDFMERKTNTDVREKHRLVASPMRPNEGLNPQPSGVRDDAQPTEPPGQSIINKFLKTISFDWCSSVD